MEFYGDGTPVGLGLVKLAFAQQPKAPGGGVFGGMTTVQNTNSPNSSNPFTMTTAQTGTATQAPDIAGAVTGAVGTGMNKLKGMFGNKQQNPQQSVQQNIQQNPQQNIQ